MTIDQAMQLAMQHHTAGQLQQAEQIYRQVLQQVPNHADALHLLGVVAQQVGQPAAAIDLIRRAVAISPGLALYHSNLAEAYRRAGMLDEAEASCRQALAIAPDFAAALMNLGTVLHEKRKFEEAETALRRALELEPAAAQALSTLGNVLVQRGDLDGGIELGRRAVEAAPSDPIAHNNLAAALEAKGLLEEAEAEYRKAVELEPRLFEALNNLGSVIRRLGRPDEAMRWWQKSADVRPDYPDAQWNLGLGYLAQGDYQRGWPLYEWRFRCGHTAKYFREYPVLRWTGFDLKDKSILLYPEQGYGDVIQFARFIPLLGARGAKVILHLPPELIDIMKGVEGVSRIVGPDEPLPAFDTHQAILSLPSVLNITLQNLPANVPYISIDADRMSAWASRIQTEPGRRKVGIVYSGRPIPDPKRSCRFAELIRLADAKDVTFFSLQLGEAALEIRQAPSNMCIIDVHEHIKDFADTAAAVANLDLLITIDTAAAHIAGAIAKPVWTMIPFAPDYRWMAGRDDSPWYPTMRLFRQTRRDDWSDVIERIRQELLVSG